MQIWARDPSRVRKGLLTPLAGQCVLRESGVGTWSITIDDTVTGTPQVGPGWGVVVVDEGQTLFSGPIREIETEQRGNERDVTLTGVTDMFDLSTREVYPAPSQEYFLQTISHYKAKGPAETLILDLIRGQGKPDPAWPTASRAIPGLVVPVSLGRGNTTSVEARFTDLLTEVQALAAVGGLVVDVVDVNRDLTVIVREPANKARSVRFMQGHGLGNFTTKITAPSVNAVILGGQGEGADRDISGLYKAVGEWGKRIETFVDRRDTTDVDEHLKTMNETLIEGAESASASFDVTETPDLRFGTHYQLGDTVTVSFPNGTEITDGVRTADIRWDEYGREITLTVGDHSTNENLAPEWVKRISSLKRAVKRLEAAQ